jgi:predicted nucleotidyltransferase
MHPAISGPALPPRVSAYLHELVQCCAGEGRSLASLVLFGSAVIGGWSDDVSDVDLIFVMSDGATREDRRRFAGEASRIEARHDLGHRSDHKPGALERLFDTVTANRRTFFVCTRGDMLSGDIGRILDLAPSQTPFVDRVVIANIVASGKTVWGEDLLPRIPIAPIRRLDVWKAFFGLINQAVTEVMVYPFLRIATKIRDVDAQAVGAQLLLLLRTAARAAGGGGRVLPTPPRAEPHPGAVAGIAPRVSAIVSVRRGLHSDAGAVAPVDGD